MISDQEALSIALLRLSLIRAWVPTSLEAEAKYSQIVSTKTVLFDNDAAF